MRLTGRLRFTVQQAALRGIATAQALQRWRCAKRCLQAACQGVFAQVVDNSGGLMLLQIQGTAASTFLRHLSPYHVGSLQAGQVVSTVLKKTTVVLHKLADDDYVLLFRRSFADYLWRIFDKTSKPYGYGLSKHWQFTQPDWQRYSA